MPYHNRQTLVLLLGICLLCLTFLQGYTLQGKHKKADKDFVPPPYMALVRQALVNKQLGVAARFLKAARTCWQKRQKACGFRKHTYLIYLGVLTLQRGQEQRAVKLLQQANTIWKSNPPKRPRKPTKASKEAQTNHQRLGQTLSFYLGQAYFRTKQYKRAIPALQHARAAVGKMPGYYRLLALSQIKAKQYKQARQTLQQGFNAFPNEQGLLQVAATLYLQVGAWNAALQIGRRLLRLSPKPAPNSFLMVVDAMRKAGLVYQILPLLEEARLHIPTHQGILLRLAIAYSQAQMHTAAATCFSTLAPLQPQMAYYAAASWMQAGHLRNALLWNQRVQEPAKRRQQRSRILLHQGQLARAFTLLKRQWLQKTLPPAGRYRLAHVALRMGQYTIAQNVLDSLSRTPYATSANKLKQTVRLCRATPWRCLD